jgi:hypothetical protein
LASLHLLHAQKALDPTNPQIHHGPSDALD